MGRCTVVKSAPIVKRSWNQEKYTLPWPWVASWNFYENKFENPQIFQQQSTLKASLILFFRTIPRLLRNSSKENWNKELTTLA
jgi:hypothetical protein